jgi:hypothetical protein
MEPDVKEETAGREKQQVIVVRVRAQGKQV